MIADIAPRLLEWFGGIAIVTAALAWLAKSILTHWLSKNIEIYKSALKHDSDMRIEEIKSQLQILAGEHSFRFSKLHEKRADIVAELYYLIDSTDTNVGFFQTALELHAGKIDADEVNRTAKVAEDDVNLLWKFVQKNQLYFGEQLAKEIESLMFALSNPLVDFVIHGVKVMDSTEGASSSYRELTERWKKQNARIQTVKNMIKVEFRKILGSDNS